MRRGTKLAIASAITAISDASAKGFRARIRSEPGRIYAVVDDAAATNAITKGFNVRRAGRRRRHGSVLAPSDTRADPGILRVAQDVANRRLDANCDEGFIDCVGGFTANGTSCADACGGECCINKEACSNFTGRVCADGGSCVGPYACFYASVGTVIDSCDGNLACAFAGEGGYIGFLYASCQGNKSCFEAAYYGYIGGIHESCHDVSACAYAAPFGGNITKISDGSCVGDHSCTSAAAGGINSGAEDTGGSIGGIFMGSCVGDHACASAASDLGHIESMHRSCRDDYACYNVASIGGRIGKVNASCNAPHACSFVGYSYSGTGSGENGYSYSIGVIEGSCNANRSCHSVGRFGDEFIPEMSNCCNTEEECELKTAAELAPNCTTASASLFSSSSNEPSTWGSSRKLTNAPTASPNMARSGKESLTDKPSAAMPRPTGGKTPQPTSSAAAPLPIVSQTPPPATARPSAKPMREPLVVGPSIVTPAPTRSPTHRPNITSPLPTRRRRPRPSATTRAPSGTGAKAQKSAKSAKGQKSSKMSKINKSGKADGQGPEEV